MIRRVGVPPTARQLIDTRVGKKAMAEPQAHIVPIPTQGFLGIKALIELGAERVRALAEAQSQQPLDLSFPKIYERLTASLSCDRSTLHRAFLHALIPLNGLRRNLEMEPSVFLRSLDRTVREQTPDGWDSDDLERWGQLLPALVSLFEPDNFFSIASKAFDLLSERPAILQTARILTEYRPIYDESTTRTVALLQTNTLVVDYWDGHQVSSLHLTLDGGDVDALHSELARAKKKIEIGRAEALQKGIVLAAYGEGRGDH